MTGTQVATRKLLNDFNAVASDIDQLLTSVASAGGDKTHALRMSVEKSLKAAKEQLRDYQDAAIERARAATKATDEYVHENPWQSVAIGAALGAVIGVVAGMLIGRR